MRKLLSVFGVLVVAGVVAALYWYPDRKSIEVENGTWFGDQARALPEFELIDQNNEMFTRERLKGYWNLLFFGYTQCPDVCPTTLQDMNQMVRTIDDPDVRDAVKVYFVSVDPERDTPEKLATYVNYFNSEFVGATATAENLKTLTRPLGIAYEIYKSSDDDVFYDVQHSSAVVLINPQAEFAGVFSAPHEPLPMARDMTRIVESN